MDKIIVIKTQGKGDSYADYVSVHLFDTSDDAMVFIANNLKDGKHWSNCQIVKDGSVVETHYDNSDY